VQWVVQKWELSLSGLYHVFYWKQELQAWTFILLKGNLLILIWNVLYVDRATQWRIGIMCVSWLSVIVNGFSGRDLWSQISIKSGSQPAKLSSKIQSQPHMAPTEGKRPPLLSWFQIMPWMSLHILMMERAY